MKRAKPHLRLRLDGSIDVLRAGNLGWSSADARGFIVDLSGDVQSYCRRMRLNYGQVCAALRPSWAYRGAGASSYVRLLFGLPIQPSKLALARAAKRGDTRVRDLLQADEGARP